MTKFIHDCMVSYKRDDESYARALVTALEQDGFRVWWDQNILPGQDIDEKVQEAIDQSRYIVLCVSPRAIKSNYVSAEVDISSGRIIPVFIEPTDLPVGWKAKIGKLLKLDLPVSNIKSDTIPFKILCKTLRSPSLNNATTHIPASLKDKAIQMIRSTADNIDLLALLIAASMVEGAPEEEMITIAYDLESKLRERFPEQLPVTGLGIKTRKEKMDVLQLEIFMVSSPKLGLPVTCVRFKEHGIGPAILATAWTEFDMLRQPILSWANNWAAGDQSIIRMCVALNFGILGQSEEHFFSVWRNIFMPMLKLARRRGNKATKLFEVADLALSFAALEPSIQKALDTILNEMIDNSSDEDITEDSDMKKAVETAQQVAFKSTQTEEDEESSSETHNDNNNDDEQNSKKNQNGGVAFDYSNILNYKNKMAPHNNMFIVARLACGYTGTRFPGLAVETLKHLAKEGSIRSLLQILETYFKDMMTSSNSITSEVHWDPVDIMRELNDWAKKEFECTPPSDQKDWPLMIFYLVIHDLPLTSKTEGQLSLTSLLRSRRGINALKHGILRALTLSDHVKPYSTILRNWRVTQIKESVDPDPVFALAAALYSAAPTPRDKERIIFLLKYDENNIVKLLKKFPELAEEINNE